MNLEKGTGAIRDVSAPEVVWRSEAENVRIAAAPAPVAGQEARGFPPTEPAER